MSLDLADVVGDDLGGVELVLPVDGSPVELVVVVVLVEVEDVGDVLPPLGLVLGLVLLNYAQLARVVLDALLRIIGDIRDNLRGRETP